jgi:predicted nucleic acid-binding Zn finger protein
VHKPLRNRWLKAQALVRANGVQRWGVGYRVRSSQPGGWYYVRAYIRKGMLVSGQCSCPDHGTIYYRGVPVCKHVLATALYIYQQEAH